MNIQELEAKVTAAADKVAKITATIGKHEAAAAKKLTALEKFGINAENMAEKKWLGGVSGSGSSAHYWEICEVESKLDDAKGARRKLRDAEAILANWKEKLALVVEKERFLNEEAPAVIIEFLNRWKEQARDWHIQGHTRYVELKTIIGDLESEAKAAYVAANPDARTWGREYDTFMKGQKELNKAKREQAILGGVVATMAAYRDETARLPFLERVLEEDRKAKMFDLINKVNAIVGTITDASYLRVNEKGNLDGYVIGERGKAHVSTVGVGGYNIVCFHYRTNVYEIKDKEVLKLGKSKPMSSEMIELHNEAEKEVEAEQAALETESNGQTALKLEDAVSGGGPGEIVGKLGQQLHINF